ncbi:MAG: aldehyde ferredoxin oxidoreductase family protein [Candidatus Atribacteria bacterium]
MYGYWKRILRVDLSKSLISVEKVDQSFFEKYIGGAGIAANIILSEVRPDVEPFSPDNVIVFGVGPFQGIRVAGSGRWIVASKSPLTGIWADSCAGGNWGPEFKRTGFDAIIIKGKASLPVYLWINDEKVEIRNASKIWGKKTSETDEEIKKDLGEPKAKVACIGPGGEKLVRFASVVNEHGNAGRCGLGAVIGSKNLKAVVVRGTKQVEIAEPEETNKYSKTLFKKYYDATVNTMRKYGTTASVKKYYDRGYGLTKNWKEWMFEGIDGIDGKHFLDITVKSIACTYCPIACHRRTKVNQPEKYAYEGYGPEYETISMLGWLNKISDAKAIGYMGYLCDEYGIDTMTTGSLIGFVTECYEKGWITKEDLNGIEPCWGDTDAAIALIHKIVKREGLGGILAEGVVKAAEYVGHDASKIIVHCKGLDYPAHDPRSFFPAVINYATGTRGACHQRGFATWHASGVLIPEWGITKVFETGSNTLHSMENAPEITVKYQNWATLFNSLVQCEYMIFGGLTLTHQINLLKYITGWDVDATYLSETAERIFNLQRIINIYCGISKKDDSIPFRMFEPLKDGKSAGKKPLPFDKTLLEYYKLRVWDNEGEPTVKRLVELNLTEALRPAWK